jgi:hypothetical protein
VQGVSMKKAVSHQLSAFSLFAAGISFVQERQLRRQDLLP